MPSFLPSRERPLKEPEGTIPRAVASDMVPFGSTIYQGMSTSDKTQSMKDMSASFILGLLGSAVASPILFRALRSSGGSEIISKVKRLAAKPTKENRQRLVELIKNNPKARKALAQLGVFNVASAGVSGTADETLNRYRNNEKLISKKDIPFR